ncbi:DUF1641 domain-containing protein [Sulfoacidibacillus thermotolerans]|uniref:DUF1641 domain-containing protein n=1 Tax=Sulfoacidibacillus thermotolerans TaxID=1765684 RepID=A0A2U3D6W7_SULT2|nr:DUF1641 domain-containing protein [Sulfoacidibacillus thermotolerans]PWI57022.1 hypothetical protein BM613_10700 [Sulfoacidibacillus thermotolerans]
MAEAITQIKLNPVNSQQVNNQRIDDLLQFLLAHEDAFRQIVEIIGELSNSGILTMLWSGMKAKDKIFEIALTQMKAPEMTTAIQNSMRVASLLSHLEESDVQILVSALRSGIEEGVKETAKEKSQSVFDFFALARDPDIRRAVAFFSGMLKGVGKELTLSNSETS